EQTLLDVREGPRAVGLRPLRALRGGPQDVGPREVAGVLEAEVDGSVVGVGVVGVVDVDGELPVVGGHHDLESVDLCQAGAAAATTAEQVGDGEAHWPAFWAPMKSS